MSSSHRIKAHPESDGDLTKSYLEDRLYNQTKTILKYCDDTFATKVEFNQLQGQVERIADRLDDLTELALENNKILKEYIPFADSRYNNLESRVSHLEHGLN